MSNNKSAAECNILIIPNGTQIPIRSNEITCWFLGCYIYSKSPLKMLTLMNNYRDNVVGKQVRMIEPQNVLQQQENKRNKIGIFGVKISHRVQKKGNRYVQKLSHKIRSVFKDWHNMGRRKWSNIPKNSIHKRSVIVQNRLGIGQCNIMDSKKSTC